MNAEEKVKTVLLALYNYSKVRPNSQPFSYNPFTDETISAIPSNEICSILEKCESDYQIIQIIERPDLYFTDDKDEFDRENDPGDLQTIGFYTIKILDKFEYFVEPHLFADEPISEIIKEQKKMDEDLNDFKKWGETYANMRDNAFSIEYTEQREILLNGYFLLGKPNFNSENDLVFNYLIEHPNATLNRSGIEKAIGIKLTKSLHKIIENLGFNAELRKLFFHITKDFLYFRNPVTKEDLTKLGINKIRIK